MNWIARISFQGLNSEHPDRDPAGFFEPELLIQPCRAWLVCYGRCSDSSEISLDLFERTNAAAARKENAMLMVHVHARVKPEAIEAFKRATLENARASLKEAGIARFDVGQQMDDPTSFVLVEVYRDAEAPARHKETTHYAAWRDTVASMMAAPRASVKYESVFPAEDGW